MRRLIASAVVLGLVFHPIISAEAATGIESSIQGTPEYYFWNEVTGDVQWEDPGGKCNSVVVTTFALTHQYSGMCQ